MNITTRKATQNDLKAIQDLNHKLFEWDLENDPALNTSWPYEEEGETYFKKRISGEQGVCLVAELNGTIVGYVAGEVREKIGAADTVLRSELDNIFVQLEHRHSGVGKTLVEAFLQWCHENGSSSTFVMAYAGNSSALEFYESCGFDDFVMKIEHRHGNS